MHLVNGPSTLFSSYINKDEQLNIAYVLHMCLLARVLIVGACTCEAASLSNGKGEKGILNYLSNWQNQFVCFDYKQLCPTIY